MTRDELREQFPLGCRVRLTEFGRRVLCRTAGAATAGRVAGYCSRRTLLRHGPAVRVLRDGHRHPETFAVRLWETDGARAAADAGSYI